MKNRIFLFAFFFSIGFSFVSITTGFAASPHVFHESDSGSTINITQDEVITFSFADNNSESTSQWMEWMPWFNENELLFKKVSFNENASMSDFTYYGGKATGQLVLMFCQYATKEDRATYRDQKHPLQKILTFIINVNSPTAQ